MAKVTLDNITSGFASRDLFNINFDAIEAEFNQKVLYRDNPAGESNRMKNVLDMDSNDIINVANIDADGMSINGVDIVPTGTTSLPATGLTYDNTTSGLTATNVQAAIDEVEGRVDTAETNITSNDTQLARGNNHGKNLIINGDFSVWQRGTSTTASEYIADRWLHSLSGATSTASRQTHTLGQTDVPGNPTYFLRMDVTTGNDNSGMAHRIENVSTAAGQEITLSFYAKGTNPGGGSLDIKLEQIFGTGGSPSSTISTILGTCTLTASWQRFTYTTTVPSISGKTLGTNGDDYLQIFLTQGSDTSTDAWQLDISNVQLEFGDTATDFEYVDLATQLMRCKRYFERKEFKTPTAITMAQAESATTAIANLDFLEKRDIPSITVSGGSLATVQAAGSDGGGTAAFANISKVNSWINMTGAIGLVAGNAVRIYAKTSDVNIDIDAEL